MFKRLGSVLVLSVVLSACHNTGHVYCELDKDPFLTRITLGYDFKHIKNYKEEVRIKIKDIDEEIIKEYVKDLKDYRFDGEFLYVYFEYELEKMSKDEIMTVFRIEDYRDGSYFHLDRSIELLKSAGFSCKKIKE